MRERGFNVIPIPGPSALTAFLSASGLTENSDFAGFFPRKTSLAKQFCDTFIFYSNFFESGKRILESLKWLNNNYEINELVVAKEITKSFERFISGIIKM